MTVEKPYRTCYVIYGSDFDERQDHKKERKRPQIENEYLLMFREPSEFLSES
jgi:hypothetical protein